MLIINIKRVKILISFSVTRTQSTDVTCPSRFGALSIFTCFPLSYPSFVRIQHTQNTSSIYVEKHIFLSENVHSVCWRCRVDDPMTQRWGDRCRARLFCVLWSSATNKWIIVIWSNLKKIGKVLSNRRNKAKCDR